MHATTTTTRHENMFPSTTEIDAGAESHAALDEGPPRTLRAVDDGLVPRPPVLPFDVSVPLPKPRAVRTSSCGAPWEPPARPVPRPLGGNTLPLSPEATNTIRTLLPDRTVPPRRGCRWEQLNRARAERARQRLRYNSRLR
jgi:hypothetical protein